jgi:hypothetical protein
VLQIAKFVPGPLYNEANFAIIALEGTAAFDDCCTEANPRFGPDQVSPAGRSAFACTARPG